METADSLAIYSLTWGDFPDAPEGVAITISCSAVRRVDGREMSNILLEIGTRWEAIVQSYRQDITGK